MKILNILVLLFCFCFSFLSFFITRPEINLANIFKSPSLTSPFGTDFLGKDVLVELIHASAASLSIGLCSAAFACIIGTLVAILMQFAFKNFILKLLDLLIATPSLILIMFIQSLIDGGKLTIIFLFACTHFAILSKTLNVFFSSYLKQDYIQNLIIFKASKMDIFKQISSVLFSIIFVLFIQNTAHIILSESTLSFFGLGLKPYEASIGNMLNDNAKCIYLGHYHLILAPGLYLFLLIFSLNNLSGYMKNDRY